MSESDGNSRMDRVEHYLELLAQSQSRTEENLSRTGENLNRLEENLSRLEENLSKTENNLRKTENMLHRAIAAGVRDARRQRIRNREFDQKITQLASAQLLTEEKLQGFIESLRRGSNGHQ
jgi:septal ring factor EnvC (AmiA/AmiB activator)